MDFSLSEDQRMMRDSVRKLMDEVATPEYVRRLDREQRYPDELYAAWVRLGILGLPFPEAYGGLGGSVMDLVLIAEEVSRKSPDLYMAFSGSVFCGLNIVRKGTEAQKRHWLPQLLSGKIKMSISMSEPDAGSDVGAMRASARRDGGDYVVSGQKLWATGAGAKDNVINVYLRTDPTANIRQGMSLFLIDNDAPGVKLRKLDMLGRRSTGTYEIFFDEVRVPPERLIGGENNGWSCVLAGLQAERICSAAGNLGAAQACLNLSVEYARERKQFGRPIGSNQALAHMLADLAAELEAARALTWRAAWMVSQGEDALREISMAKL
ncbi:MAG TPA: acyl-CoA dehydrogenase family protein, partial [Candidatus Binataceae bacterium]|nr:acyl-CoA dehydrogenase family protein [Candidatus Binataceae bacterium]